MSDNKPDSMSIDILNDLCLDGCKNPMKDAEAAAFVDSVRKERGGSAFSDYSEETLQAIAEAGRIPGDPDLPAYVTMEALKATLKKE